MIAGDAFGILIGCALIGIGGALFVVDARARRARRTERLQREMRSVARRIADAGDAIDRIAFTR